MLIDTHCHLDFDWYDDDRADVIARAWEAGLAAVVNPSVHVNNSAAVAALAAAHDRIYAAVGIHPNSSADFNAGQIDILRHLAGGEKVVAIGEIGLDYYRDHSPRQTQRHAFEAQLALAAEIELPVIIHNREATDDVLDVLEAWITALPESHPLRARPGVLHSFSGDVAAMDRTVALGFYVGITGPVTFKKADELRRVAAAAPVDRLLVETDGPFLTPHPYRGKRNEPAHVRYVAERIASVRQMDDAALARQTTENAVRLFRLPLDV